MINEDQKNLILDWCRKIHTLEYAHRFHSKTYDDRNLFFGIPSIILGGIITVQVINSYSPAVIGLGGCIISILSGLQTFLKPSEVAEKHRRISETYEKLRHRLEYLLIYHLNDDPKDFQKQLEIIHSDWNHVETLNVPEKIYNAARQQVSKLNAYPLPLSFHSKYKKG